MQTDPAGQANDCQILFDFVLLLSEVYCSNICRLTTFMTERGLVQSESRRWRGAGLSDETPNRKPRPRVQRGVSNASRAAGFPRSRRLGSSPLSPVAVCQVQSPSTFRAEPPASSGGSRGEGRRERPSAASVGGFLPALDGMRAAGKIIPTSNGPRESERYHSRHPLTKVAGEQGGGEKAACGVWACSSGRVKAERAD